jgi:hypothetical protein
MVRRNKGLGNCVRLTETTLLEAVRETVISLQNGGTDKDMAVAWGVSKGTVENARNRNHVLSATSLLKLGDQFRAEGLDTIMALIGLKAVERDAVTIDVAGIPCDVAKTLPLLIELLTDGDCSAADVRALDKAGAIDCLGRVADMLRERRNAVRLESVA